jgi:hypothetical protein
MFLAKGAKNGLKHNFFGFVPSNVIPLKLKTSLSKAERTKCIGIKIIEMIITLIPVKNYTYIDKP